MKKDFSKGQTNSYYDDIDLATADPDKRGPRRTYSEEEAQPYLMNMDTAGRKGLHLKRINLAFAPDVYEYIQIMSRVRGESLTAFVNHALRQNMEEHRDVYEKAIEFRNSL